MPLQLSSTNWNLSWTFTIHYYRRPLSGGDRLHGVAHSLRCSRMISCILLAIAVGCGPSSSSPVSPSGSDPIGEPVTLDVVPADVQLSPGDSVKLEAVTRDENGQIVEGDGTIEWSSSDAGTAEVDSQGSVMAQTEGTARIHATFRPTDEGQSISDSAAVEVASTGSSGPSQQSFRAFPEAEGWGATALTQCDRGNIQVLPVTNLDDSGAGSLRDAIARVDNNRLSVIIFRTAGYITLNSRIRLDKSCLYIAGQTAPGSGITIRAPDKQVFMFRNGPLSDVVIRYLRIRPGTRRPGENTNSQAILVFAGTNIVLDHLSLSWANDQLLSVFKPEDSFNWGPLHSVTLQKTLLSEPLRASPVCYSVKGRTFEDANGIPGWYEVDRITYHHNAAIHCDHRSPVLSARGVEVINNVVYHWNQYAMRTNRKTYADFIGNYFRRGPANRPVDSKFAYEINHAFLTNRPGGGKGNEPDGYTLIGNTENIDGRAGPGLYLQGNAGLHNSFGSANQWALVSKHKNDFEESYPEAYAESVVYGNVENAPIEVNGVSLRRTVPLTQPPIPVTIESAESAWRALIVDKDVGSNRRLECDGQWVENIDAVDARVLREAETGTASFPDWRTGIPSPEDVGGYPPVDKGTPCQDADADGMPDAFEGRFALDPSSPSDASTDVDGDGYTNLEEFLNGTPPR